MKHFDYPSSITYLNRFSNYEKNTQVLRPRFSLGPIRELLKALENPERCAPAVHMAGTVGKGSVCHMIDSVLNAAGHRTCLYTSPHLQDIRERIMIDRRMISKAAFARAVGRVREAAADSVDRYTFFDLLTASAFVAAQQNRADISIIETGLGGRLDSTNAVPASVNVITTIGRDHRHVLGMKLEQIAAEKAGIIKRGAVVVSAPQPASAMRVIREKCKKMHAELTVAAPGKKAVRPSPLDKPDLYEVRFRGLESVRVHLPLSGGFQHVNLEVALTALEAVVEAGFMIDADSLKRGLEAVRLAGRMQRLRLPGADVEMILDGAHNEPAAKSLADSLLETERGREIVFLVGMMKDKEGGPILRELGRAGDRLVAVRLQMDRAHAAGELEEIARESFAEVMTADGMREGIDAAVGAARKAGKKSVVCVTGSLYAVAEAQLELAALGAL